MLKAHKKMHLSALEQEEARKAVKAQEEAKRFHFWAVTEKGLARCFMKRGNLHLSATGRKINLK